MILLIQIWVCSNLLVTILSHKGILFSIKVLFAFKLIKENGTVEAMELRVRTMTYHCNKTGRIPYYSSQMFKIYVIDHLNIKKWFHQKINFYIYSKKVNVFKSVMAKILGVMIVLFLIFTVLSYCGYIKTKKQKSGFTPAEL